jgi:hypothetical protein
MIAAISRVFFSAEGPLHMHEATGSFRLTLEATGNEHSHNINEKKIEKAEHKVQEVRKVLEGLEAGSVRNAAQRQMTSLSRQLPKLYKTRKRHERMCQEADGALRKATEAGIIKLLEQGWHKIGSHNGQPYFVSACPLSNLDEHIAQYLMGVKDSDKAIAAVYTFGHLLLSLLIFSIGVDGILEIFGLAKYAVVRYYRTIAYTTGCVGIVNSFLFSLCAWFKTVCSTRSRPDCIPLFMWYNDQYVGRPNAHRWLVSTFMGIDGHGVLMRSRKVQIPRILLSEAASERLELEKERRLLDGTRLWEIKTLPSSDSTSLHAKRPWEKLYINLEGCGSRVSYTEDQGRCTDCTLELELPYPFRMLSWTHQRAKACLRNSKFTLAQKLDPYYNDLDFNSIFDGDLKNQGPFANGICTVFAVVVEICMAQSITLTLPVWILLAQVLLCAWVCFEPLERCFPELYTHVAMTYHFGASRQDILSGIQVVQKLICATYISIVLAADHGAPFGFLAADEYVCSAETHMLVSLFVIYPAAVLCLIQPMSFEKLPFPNYKKYLAESVQNQYNITAEDWNTILVRGVAEDIGTSQALDEEGDDKGDTGDCLSNDEGGDASSCGLSDMEEAKDEDMEHLAAEMGWNFTAAGPPGQGGRVLV